VDLSKFVERRARMTVQKLTEADAAALREIRLRALREHPEAFGSSYEDEAKLSPEAMQEWVRPHVENCMLGSWLDSELVGIVSFRRNPGHKVRHRAGLGAMYVAPEARGRGVGMALVNAAIEHAHRLPALEEVTLAVTVGNEAARRLYLAAGFVPTHIEKRYIKIDQQYYDIEWMTLRF